MCRSIVLEEVKACKKKGLETKKAIKVSADAQVISGKNGAKGRSLCEPNDVCFDVNNNNK